MLRRTAHRAAAGYFNASKIEQSTPPTSEMIRVLNWLNGMKKTRTFSRPQEEWQMIEEKPRGRVLRCMQICLWLFSDLYEPFDPLDPWPEPSVTTETEKDHVELFQPIACLSGFHPLLVVFISGECGKKLKKTIILHYMKDQAPKKIHSNWFSKGRFIILLHFWHYRRDLLLVVSPSISDLSGKWEVCPKYLSSR